MEKKRALISVSNKEGIVEFVTKLVEDLNYEIISTGGTRDKLKKAGIKTTKVENITNFPEMLDGRVKTLHPSIHGAILARRDKKDHIQTLKKQDIKPIDLVVVNLYPFKEVASKPDSSIEDIIENIDIGGPTLIRSAAKNHDDVIIICNPHDYEPLLDEMLKNKGNISLKTRRMLAVKAYEHTSNYDKHIYRTLNNLFELPESPDNFEIQLTKIKDLRYGENPHQSAALYVNTESNQTDLPFTILQGKELSYNNLADLTEALKIIKEFDNIPAACIIKHANPCGVAIGKTHLEAYKKALNCDPISAFGGIIGINGPIDKELAELLSSMFLEVIASTEFTEDARYVLQKKKNLRLIEIPANMSLQGDYKFKDVAGGILVQTSDTKMITKDDLDFVSNKKPSDAELDDLMFAWKVVKHVGSNAIVIAKNGQTIGIGCGQTSRIGAMEIALRQACDQAKDAVVASDGFFPAIDNIQAAAQSRISSIIQPGGSIKDKDVIETIDKLGMSMVLTGCRHFKH